MYFWGMTAWAFFFLSFHYIDANGTEAANWPTASTCWHFAATSFFCTVTCLFLFIISKAVLLEYKQTIMY